MLRFSWHVHRLILWSLASTDKLTSVQIGAEIRAMIHKPVAFGIVFHSTANAKIGRSRRRHVFLLEGMSTE